MTDSPKVVKRRRRPLSVSVLLWIVRLVLVIGIVWGAFRGYRHLIDTTPTHERRPTQERVATVEVLELERTSHTVTIPATGTVVPANEIGLRAEVGGEVIEVHPNLDPGGIVEPGQVLVRINPADYELALEEAKAQVVRAEYEYKVELGQQDVARHSWKMLGGDEEKTSELEEELALRKPHLRKALAELEATRARVALAELNLKRTRVVCPFRAVVLDRTVAVGAQVNTQTELARLIDAEAFRIEVLIPADRLEWIVLPESNGAGAGATIRPSGALQDRNLWQGSVIRRLPALETAGRLARLLVEVPDPLAQGSYPLLLGSFVNVEIEGPLLEGIFVLPRKALREGGVVYLLNSESRLALQQPTVVWSNSEFVFAREGLQEGQRLILTDIASPIPGMKLALAREKSPAEIPGAEDVEKPAKGPVSNGAPPASDEGERS